MKKQNITRNSFKGFVLLFLISICFSQMNCKPTSQMDSFTLYYEYSSVRPFDSDLNVRWKINENGDVYMVKNSSSGVVPTPWTTFYADTPFPATPAATLSSQQMTKIGKSIDDNNFLSLVNYISDPQTEDGSAIKITISRKGNINSVTMVNKSIEEIKKIVADINSELPDAAKLETYPVWN